MLRLLISLAGFVSSLFSSEEGNSEGGIIDVVLFGVDLAFVAGSVGITVGCLVIQVCLSLCDIGSKVVE